MNFDPDAITGTTDADIETRDLAAVGDAIAAAQHGRPYDAARDSLSLSDAVNYAMNEYQSVTATLAEWCTDRGVAFDTAADAMLAMAAEWTAAWNKSNA